jgi:hypothetical protein
MTIPRRTFRVACAALGLMAALLPAVAQEKGDRYFKITVVDEQTGRGVPLVELSTVHNIRLFTDSNGVAAFHEPGLMGQKVFFHVKSHGYEFPKDGFGFRGKALDVSGGGSAVLKVKRLYAAERLYRVTGAGIYRDSVLTGVKVPLRRPLLNAQVAGQDSVINAVYRGKYYWFWGDTNRPSYPLGNYWAPGAVSSLPDKGGLDPALGVDLEYAADEKGFAAPSAKIPGEGPTWLGGLVVLRDKGRERLFAGYARIRGYLEVYQTGLLEFDDKSKRFERVTTFARDAPLLPSGHPFLRKVKGVEYVYFANPYPLVRVRATPEELARPERYEAFTCLAEGARRKESRLDRAPDGSLRYGWKRNTAAVGPAEQAKLIKAGKLKREEALLQLQEADTGKAVQAHGGSVYWNPYRRRWVLITVEMGGTSNLGEIWYAAADTPLGPWAYARKVVTHTRYSFYNPKQHPLFDQQGGRVIFFEGTYTAEFSGNTDRTPRYDYNQIMCRLDLADERLNLPVPVYRLLTGGRQALGPLEPGLGELPPVAFFALERPGKGTVPMYAGTADGFRLVVGKAADAKGGGKQAPLFHALPADTKAPPATTQPLYEFRRAGVKDRFYSTDPAAEEGYQRSERPVCLVWRNPVRVAIPRD